MHIHTSEDLDDWKHRSNTNSILLFYFDEAPTKAIINFRKQKIPPNSLLLVPYCNFYDIHFQNGKVWTLHVKSDDLYRSAASRIIFSDQKHSAVKEPGGFEKLAGNFEALIEDSQDHKSILDILLSQCNGHLFTNGNYAARMYYKEKAIDFMKLVESLTSFSVSETFVGSYAESLNCTQKFLQRAVYSQFGVPPQNILKQRLFNEYLKQIHTNYRMEELSLALGYSSASALSKLIKGQTGLTPFELNKLILKTSIFSKMSK